MEVTMTDCEPLISFLVVVRNERRYIERCLKSMLNQTLAPEKYEIIVIDGMSTDGSRDIVKQISDQYADRSIQLIDNPRRILSSGWNIGIKAARGQYVIRPDAHGDVPENFLEKSLAVMEAHPEATAVGGVVDTKGDGFWGKTIAAVISSRVGVGGSSFRVGGESGPAETVVFGLYKRDDLIDIGGFDEGIVLNQDNVCHARLTAAGKILYFDPSIHSTYRCRSSLIGLWKQMFRRSQWLVLMFKHQREQAFSLRYFVPLLFVCAIVGLLGLGFWQPLAWTGLAALMGVYVLIGMFAGMQKKLRPTQVLAFPLVMFVLHCSYGIGEIVGFLRFPFYKPAMDLRSPLKPI